MGLINPLWNRRLIRGEALFLNSFKYGTSISFQIHINISFFIRLWTNNTFVAFQMKATSVRASINDMFTGLFSWKSITVVTFPYYISDIALAWLYIFLPTTANLYSIIIIIGERRPGQTNKQNPYQQNWLTIMTSRNKENYTSLPYNQSFLILTCLRPHKLTWKWNIIRLHKYTSKTRCRTNWLTFFTPLSLLSALSPLLLCLSHARRSLQDLFVCSHFMGNVNILVKFRYWIKPKKGQPGMSCSS